MSRKIKILFVRHSKSSFIQKDLELLKKHFDVRVVDFVLNRKDLKGTLFTLPAMIIGVLGADVTFSWFAANFHAYMAVLLSKIFRKKSIVVVGGYEVEKDPEMGYGAMLKPRSAHMVRYILKNADRVLTVDDSLKRDAINNVGVNGRNILTVPTGHDPEFWKAIGKKEKLVLTVAYIHEINVKIKGLLTLVKAAKYIPDIEFAVIGQDLDGSLEYLKSIASSNVEFLGFLPQNELVRWYQRAKVYCQLSMYEGLPSALCEAMLCECMPVGTRNYGIPTAIGDTGFYVPYGNPKATAEAIEEALKSNKGKEARERIKDMFSVERREKELIEIMEKVLYK